MIAKPATMYRQIRFSGPLTDKWLPLFVQALLIGVLLISVWSVRQWLLDPGNLPLKNINVDGELAQLREVDIQKIMKVQLNSGFLTLNVSSIRQQLESLPWVDQAAVRRVWRDTLDVYVVEQQPVAYWGENAFLNLRGEVFTPEQATRYPSLPFLHGPEGHEAQVMQMHKVMSMMLDPIGLGIHSLTMNARRTWHLELANGMLIELGRTNIEVRMQRFIKAYPIVLAYAAERIQSVDLRYSNGFSVRWHLDNSNEQAS